MGKKGDAWEKKYNKMEKKQKVKYLEKWINWITVN